MPAYSPTPPNPPAPLHFDPFSALPASPASPFSAVLHAPALPALPHSAPTPDPDFQPPPAPPAPYASVSWFPPPLSFPRTVPGSPSPSAGTASPSVLAGAAVQSSPLGTSLPLQKTYSPSQASSHSPLTATDRPGTASTASSHSHPSGASDGSNPILEAYVDGGTGKRAQVKVACTNCQRACKKCSNHRPCTRCVRLRLPACTNALRKPRPSGLKRGPYKRRSFVPHEHPFALGSTGVGIPQLLAAPSLAQGQGSSQSSHPPSAQAGSAELLRLLGPAASSGPHPHPRPPGKHGAHGPASPFPPLDAHKTSPPVLADLMRLLDPDQAKGWQEVYRQLGRAEEQRQRQREEAQRRAAAGGGVGDGDGDGQVADGPAALLEQEQVRHARSGAGGNGSGPNATVAPHGYHPSMNILDTQEVHKLAVRDRALQQQQQQHHDSQRMYQHLLALATQYAEGPGLASTEYPRASHSFHAQGQPAVHAPAHAPLHILQSPDRPNPPLELSLPRPSELTSMQGWPSSLTPLPSAAPAPTGPPLAQRPTDATALPTSVLLQALARAQAGSGLQWINGERRPSMSLSSSLSSSLMGPPALPSAPAPSALSAPAPAPSVAPALLGPPTQPPLSTRPQIPLIPELGMGAFHLRRPSLSRDPFSRAVSPIHMHGALGKDLGGLLEHQ